MNIIKSIEGAVSEYELDMAIESMEASVDELYDEISLESAMEGEGPPSEIDDIKSASSEIKVAAKTKDPGKIKNAVGKMGSYIKRLRNKKMSPKTKKIIIGAILAVIITVATAYLVIIKKRDVKPKHIQKPANDDNIERVDTEVVSDKKFGKKSTSKPTDEVINTNPFETVIVTARELQSEIVNLDEHKTKVGVGINERHNALNNALKNAAATITKNNEAFNNTNTDIGAALTAMSNDLDKLLADF